MDRILTLNIVELNIVMETSELYNSQQPLDPKEYHHLECHGFPDAGHALLNEKSCRYA